jgi:Domain of unknown function (DUF4145)
MSTASAAETSGFEFLDQYGPVLRPKLEEAMALADTYPDSSLAASRTFSELLLNQIAARVDQPLKGMAGDPKENQAQFTDRLRDAGHIPRDQADAFHAIRQTANTAVHEAAGTRAQARNAVQWAKKIATWFNADAKSSMRPTSEETPENASERARQAAAGDNVYQFNRATTAAPAPTRELELDAPSSSSTNAAIAVVIFGVVLCGIIYVWNANSSSGGANTQPQPTPVASVNTTPSVVPFPSPQTYVVVPGGRLADVNERSGPSWTYGVVQKFNRGSYVTGSGRAVDADGVGWIQLSDGGGFIKETLLAPSVAPTATNTPPPPAPDATPQNPPSDSGNVLPTIQAPPQAPPVQQPTMVQYQVCPPPGTPLPCQLSVAPVGAPPAFQYPPGYGQLSYPRTLNVRPPRTWVAPQAAPSPGRTFFVGNRPYQRRR